MPEDIIRRKLDALPAAPGVYVFKDRSGGVLYVGKARSLRSRVRSYFAARPSDDRAFIPWLAHELADLETFVVANEKEAALLENELIKAHQPRYNVKLRDDKDFLSVRIDPNEPWPRLRVVRRPKPDGARYYGPYDSASSARQTLRLANRYFKLRTCKDSELRSRTRPCLQHQIGRCPAPCVKEVDREAYLGQVDLVGLFLEGRHEKLVEDLEAKMKAAASAMAFEQAATYRDQLRAVERARTSQRVSNVDGLDRDALGLHREGSSAEVALLEIRQGRLTRVHTFSLDDASLPDDELISSFVGAYYRGGARVPDEVLLPEAVEAAEGLAAWLSELRGRRVEVKVPKRGDRRRLIEMAEENAAHAFVEKARAADDIERRLAELQRRLRLPTLPRHIECVDISHTGGDDTVAAIAAMVDGELVGARRKSYHVKKVRGGDDYGAMYEVLYRRFRRASEGEAGWALPDLLVVDGGRGQLAVALAAMKALGIEGLAVAGLAKAREREGRAAVGERVFLPNQKNPIPLEPRSAGHHLLVKVRDEAHRASNALRLELGRRRRLRSGLEDLPGIGEKTRRRLLSRLGSLRAVQEADEATLREAGATRTQAATIARAFGSPGTNELEEAAAEAAFDES